MSETMLFNVQNHLKVCEDLAPTEYFIIAASNPDQGIAEEAVLSMISNSDECPEDLVDCLLRSYFSKGRYIRERDALSIDIRSLGLVRGSRYQAITAIPFCSQ